MPDLYIYFVGIITLGHGNFEEQNKVLESSIIIINPYPTNVENRVSS